MIIPFVLITFLWWYTSLSHPVNAFSRNYKIIGISFLLKTAADAAANVEMIATTAYLHLQHLQSFSSKSSLLRKSNYKSPKLLYVKYCLLRGIIRFSEDCRLRGKNQPEVAGDPSQREEQRSWRVPSVGHNFISSASHDSHLPFQPQQVDTCHFWISSTFVPFSMFGDWHMQHCGLTLVPGDPPDLW